MHCDHTTAPVVGRLERPDSPLAQGVRRRARCSTGRAGVRASATRRRVHLAEDDVDQLFASYRFAEGHAASCTENTQSQRIGAGRREPPRTAVES